MALTSLNPYSNGICSLRVCWKTDVHSPRGLNPYSNGICSLRDIIPDTTIRLILS